MFFCGLFTLSPFACDHPLWLFRRVCTLFDGVTVHACLRLSPIVRTIDDPRKLVFLR